MKVEMSKAVDSRVAGEFNPSPEERSLGAYKEVLEPQVRDAVLLLRKKGYSTYESGFVVPGVTQNIKSFDRVFEGVIIPDTLIECLASDGVKLEVSPNEIFLHFDKFISLEEIKRIWDMVANALPDLGHIITPKMPNATKTDLSGFLVE